MSNQAVLFLTHVINEKIVRRFDAIDLPPNFKKWMLIDHTGEIDMKAAGDRNIIEFAMSNLITDGYWPIDGKLIPGSNHFPVIKIAATMQPFCSHVWAIEFDVMYNGKWSEFFQSFDESADFLSCHIRRYSKENAHWRWWMAGVDKKQLVASFNPIYRISTKCAKRLSITFKQNLYRGHHECTIPTLLDVGGYTIEDIGNCSEFTPADRIGLHYTDKTMKWRPTHKTDSFTELNKLYHPVKL